MSETVDSIIADLDVRYAKYVSGFGKAIDVNKRFGKSIAELQRLGMAPPAQYADGFAKAAEKGAAAHEKAATRRKRATKDVTDAEVVATAELKRLTKEREAVETAAARASAAAVKAAEKAKQLELKATQHEQEKAAKAALAKAEAERLASAAVVAALQKEEAQRERIALMVDRAASRRGAQIAPAVNSSIGATVPRGATGQRGIPRGYLEGVATAEVEVEKEINHLLVEQAENASRIGILKGRERATVAGIAAEQQLINRLQRAGLDDAAIALRLEERQALIARQRQIDSRKQASLNASGFARGAGLNRGGGSAAAIGGIAAASVAFGAVAIAKQGLDYAKDLKNVSDQLGLTTRDLQIYQTAAAQAGVTSEQLRTSFGQLAGNLGRAQQGSEEQLKVFQRLNIDIGNQRDGFKSLSDVLPTFRERLSKIPDQSRRFAIETALGGEELRKLDPILAQGGAAFDGWAKKIEDAGGILSDGEIQRADVTAKKIGLLTDQLNRDISGTVAANAGAIEALATAFLRAADAALKYFGVAARQGSLDIINSPSTVKVANGITRRLGLTDKTPQGVAQQAVSDLLSDPEGRKSLLQRNANQIRAVRAASKYENQFSTFEVAGEHTIQNTAAGRADALRRLQVDRRRIVAAGKADTPAPTPVQGGAPGDTSNLFAPKPTKPPKGPKGKSADQLEREEESRTKQFNDQLAQSQADYLRAQEQMTGDTNRRADIELQLLDTANKARLADIESNRKRNVLAGADEAIEASRAKQLVAAENAANQADRAATLQQRDFDIQRELTSATQTQLDIQSDLISSQLSLATTMKERRRLSLELLDAEKKKEYSRLAGVIGSTAPGSRESLDAEEGLRNLDKVYEGRTKNTLQGTASPLEAYRKSLHDATDDTNEALEGVAVNGLGRLEDQIASSIGKVLGLKGAFGDLFGSILTDLAKIELEKGILAFLDRGKDGSSGGGGIGGLFSGIAKILGGRASGGNVVGGGSYLVGENGPEVVNFPSSGKVYPNGALPSLGGAPSASGDRHFHISVDARNSVNPDGFEQRLSNKILSAAAQMDLETGKETLRQAPGYIGRSRQYGAPKTI